MVQAEMEERGRRGGGEERGGEKRSREGVGERGREGKGVNGFLFVVCASLWYWNHGLGNERMTHCLNGIVYVNAGLPRVVHGDLNSGVWKGG